MISFFGGVPTTYIHEGMQLNTATKPWPHQFRGIKFERDNDMRGMLAPRMGCGKSKTLIDLVCNSDSQNILICCPQKVQSVWPEEFRKHAGQNVAVFTGTDCKSVEEKARAAFRFVEDKNYLPGTRKVIVVNYETVWRHPFDKFLLEYWTPDTIACDESHRIKSAVGKASRFLAMLGKFARVRVPLTGTPMPHSPLDIYGQFRFMRPGVLPNTITAMRAMYAQTAKHNEHMIVGFKNLDDLAARIEPFIFYVHENEVLDLPPTTHNFVEFDLNPKAMRLYKQLERDLYAEFGGTSFNAANAMVATLRLQQLTSGYLPDVDGNHVDVSDDKAGALREVLEDLPKDERVVVFAKFRPDVARIKGIMEEVQGRKCAEVSGSMNELESYASGEAQSIVLNIQSGGEGLNELVSSRYCIYYSQTHSLGQYEQSIKRIHRPGQTKHVHYIHLVAKGTVDARIYRRHDARREVIGEALGISGVVESARVAHAEDVKLLRLAITPGGK